MQAGDISVIPRDEESGHQGFMWGVALQADPVMKRRERKERKEEKRKEAGGEIKWEERE